MLIQQEELNWALSSHPAFESRSGKELSLCTKKSASRPPQNVLVS